MTSKAFDNATDANRQQGGRRNLIINGAMQVAQRGTSFNAPADSSFTLDRFAVFRNGAGILDIDQSTDAPEDFNYSLKATVDTADTSLGGTDFGGIRYVVEGYDSSHINFGASSAKQITLSFYAKSNITGTYSVAFRNSAANRYYAAEYTIGSADTWERKEITITADTSGTWVTDNGKGIDLRFCLWEGGFTAAPNAWGDGNVVGSNGTTTSWIATVGNTFYITGVQLEVGTVATPFEHRSYGEELALCQRYYWQQGGGLFTRFGGGIALGRSTTLASSMAIPPVPMRSFPTVSTLNLTNTKILGQAVQSLAINGEEGSLNNSIVGPIRILLTVNSGLTDGDGYEWESGNTNTTRVYYDSEL